MQTENAEMYLVTMALLEEQGTPQPIPLPQLAEALDVQVVSVNQMVRKLEEEGLVSYQPYKGVSFSENGAAEVQAILRHRRLWETFFVKHLGYSPEVADTLACRMEHVTETGMSERLSTFLANPNTSPTGKAIPGQPGSLRHEAQKPLSQIQVGHGAIITELQTSPAIRSYLESQGLKPGSEIRLQAVSGNQVWLVAVKDGSISLDHDLVDQIMVSPMAPKEQNER